MALQPHAPAEFVDIGSGSTSGLTACACGAISTFDAGFVTIGEQLKKNSANIYGLYSLSFCSSHSGQTSLTHSF